MALTQNLNFDANMKNPVLFIILIFFLSRCTSKQQEHEALPYDEEETVEPTFKVNQSPSFDPEPFMSKELEIEDTPRSFFDFQILFPDFQIAIDSFNNWEEREPLVIEALDTAIIAMDLNEEVESRLLNIEYPDFDSIAVFQKYETSFSISDEGPHCDLIDWKHYSSDWQLLPRIGLGQFLSFEYTEKEAVQFPSVDLEELRLEVASFCGERWANLIEDTDPRENLSDFVGISRIFFKFQLFETKSSQPQEKIIVFVVPMGC